jgi:hypothetical protein
VIKTVAAGLVVLTVTRPKLTLDGLRLTLARAVDGRNIDRATKKTTDKNGKNVRRIGH